MLAIFQENVAKISSANLPLAGLLDLQVASSSSLLKSVSLIRALLGNASQFCKAVVLVSRTSLGFWVYVARITSANLPLAGLLDLKVASLLLFSITLEPRRE